LKRDAMQTARRLSNQLSWQYPYIKNPYRSRSRHQPLLIHQPLFDSQNSKGEKLAVLQNQNGGSVKSSFDSTFHEGCKKSFGDELEYGIYF